MWKLLATLSVFSFAALAAKPLEIYFIDVEGGQSTLIVSPSGQSLLIDTGWSGHGGRDSDRILTAAKNAHVKRIDYLLITHFHEDHVGGVYNLLQRLPVENFLDHGPSTEGDKKYPMNYSEGFSKGQHTVVKPGDQIGVKGLNVTVVQAAGERIRGGEPNPLCAGAERREDDKTENAQSVGVIIEMGKFRFADLGDLGFNKSLDLVCPTNPLGKVDVWLANHHNGEEMPKALVFALHPRVAIANNGARKGGLPVAWQLVKSSPGLEDIWQLHFSVEGGKDSNSADPYLANLDENCTGGYLKLTAEADGSFSIYNSRNKFSKNYEAR